MKLPRAVWEYIEFELFNYDETKKAIEEIREEIIDSVPIKENISNTGYYSDPTARKAVSLVSNKAIRRMTKTVEAIDRALAKLRDEHRKFFELRYRKVLSWQQVCMQMHIERRTFYKYRTEIIKAVALEMGFTEANYAKIMHF